MLPQLCICLWEKACGMEQTYKRTVYISRKVQRLGCLEDFVEGNTLTEGAEKAGMKSLINVFKKQAEPLKLNCARIVINLHLEKFAICY